MNPCSRRNHGKRRSAILYNLKIHDRGQWELRIRDACVRTTKTASFEPELGLFIVADGMGGHSHGERAAELAISTIEHYVESSCNGADVTWPFGYNFDISLDSNRLATAVQLANGQVWRCSQQAPEFAGMGTTLRP